MSDLEQLYQQVILDHARRRNGAGELTGTVPSSHQVNPTCGDEVTLEAAFGEDGHLDHLIWEGSGCSISQASLSIMTDLVAGKTPAEVEEIFAAFREMMHSRGGEVSDEILDKLEDGAALASTSRFVARIKCALLGWMALRAALEQGAAAQAAENEE